MNLMVVQPRVIVEQAAWHMVMEEQAVDRVEEMQEEGGVVEKEDGDGLVEEQAGLLFKLQLFSSVNNQIIFSVHNIKLIS